MTGTAGQKRVPTSFLEALRIRLPQITHQRKLIKALQTAYRLRRMRRYALQMCDEFLPGAFTELLERNKRECQIAELGDFLEFVTSGSRGWAEYYDPTGVRFIRSLDVQMNYISDDDVVFVQPPDNSEAERIRIGPQDVLLTLTGSRIGRVAAVTTRLAGAHISQHVAILRLKSGLSSKFFATYLSLENLGQREIARLQYGQTKPGLKLDQIGEMHVIAPSIPVQARFVSVLDQYERLRAVHAEALRQADHLFQTLLHQAFAA